MISWGHYRLSFSWAEGKSLCGVWAGSECAALVPRHCEQSRAWKTHLAASLPFPGTHTSSPTSARRCQSPGIGKNKKKRQQKNQWCCSKVLEQERSYTTPLELDKEGSGYEKLSKCCDTNPGSLSLSQGPPKLALVAFWLQTAVISLYWDSLSTSGLQWGDYALLLYSPHKVFHSGYFLPAWVTAWEHINSFCLHNFYLFLVIL